MRRGLRYLPAPRSGRRRLAFVGLGLIAAMTLVWQQQATLASFIDADYTKATFTAATLTAIEPTTTAKAASIDVSWSAADGSWATPSYALNESASGSGNGTSLYTGPGTTYTHDRAPVVQSDTDLNFTDVSAGATHACGVARGAVYCWGTNSSGLGTGATASTTPAIVNGFTGKTVTDVTAGTNFSCAVASGTVYCWGLGTSGQLGNGGTTSASPVAVGNLSGKTITSISAGASHACAVASGAAYCWGLNSSGQVGDNSTIPRTTATAAIATGRAERSHGQQDQRRGYAHVRHCGRAGLLLGRERQWTTREQLHHHQPRTGRSDHHRPAQRADRVRDQRRRLAHLRDRRRQGLLLGLGHERSAGQLRQPRAGSRSPSPRPP